MKRALLLLSVLMSFAVVLQAAPTPPPGPTRTKSEKSSGQKATSAEIAQSANGWSYAKGEWVHPDGYKLVRGQVVRTTAKPGKPAPQPPGKLALENADKLTPKTAKTTVQADTRTDAEKKAEVRRKNLTPTAAPQTGSHL